MKIVAIAFVATGLALLLGQVDAVPVDEQERIDAWEQGLKYVPGTPSWVPLIDACMEAGGSRNDCIGALPPEELKKLEKSEQQRRMRPLPPNTFGVEGA